MKFKLNRLNRQFKKVNKLKTWTTFINTKIEFYNDFTQEKITIKNKILKNKYNANKNKS